MENDTTINKITAIVNTLSLLAIPIAISIIPLKYQESMQRDKINSEYIALAVTILKDEPTENNKQIRTWAVRLIDKYSEVKLSSVQQEELIKKSRLLGVESTDKDTVRHYAHTRSNGYTLLHDLKSN